MSMRINIENILKSPEEIFYEIIKRLTDKESNTFEKELSFKNSDVDIVLFDAINLILSDLNNEEGYISRLLYRMFKFEVKKNVRRDQLLILGGQLKTQHTILHKDIKRVKNYIDSIPPILKNLQRLKKAFEDKNLFLLDKNIVMKSQSYIDVLVEKIENLTEYQGALADRLDILIANEKSYTTLFKKIPRYHELKEEPYPYLTA